jgi:UDP-glucose 4-epimerase
MQTVLVTGGAGFIGSHVVDALVARGDRVRVLDNLFSGRNANLAAVQQKIEFIQGDVTDAAAVNAAVSGCDLVFHEAAIASVPRSVDDPIPTHYVDATGTLMVLDAARRAGVRRVVYAASSSAYGDQPSPQKAETDLPAPISPYAAAKLAGELYCHAFWRCYGLETVALRYFNVFGPRQDPRGQYAPVIPIFIQSLLAGRQPTIYGDGRQTRDFTFVANVVQANLLAAQAKEVAGRVFNIGNGQAINLLELVAALNRILGTSIEPLFQPARVGDVRDTLADISLARSVLGYEPRTDLDGCLRETVAFYAAGGGQ